jgi:hypothetical protein
MKNYSITEKVLTVAFGVLAVAMFLTAGLAIIQTLNF